MWLNNANNDLLSVIFRRLLRFLLRTSFDWIDWILGVWLRVIQYNFNSWFPKNKFRKSFFLLVINTSGVQICTRASQITFLFSLRINNSKSVLAIADRNDHIFQWHYCALFFEMIFRSLHLSLLLWMIGGWFPDWMCVSTKHKIRYTRKKKR